MVLGIWQKTKKIRDVRKLTPSVVVARSDSPGVNVNHVPFLAMWFPCDFIIMCINTSIYYVCRCYSLFSLFSRSSQCVSCFQVSIKHYIISYVLIHCMSTLGGVILGMKWKMGLTAFKIRENWRNLIPRKCWKYSYVCRSVGRR